MRKREYEARLKKAVKQQKKLRVAMDEIAAVIKDSDVDEREKREYVDAFAEMYNMAKGYDRIIAYYDNRLSTYVRYKHNQ